MTAVRRWLQVDPLGTEADQFPTISAAIDAAAVGDGIEVAGGVYRECLQLNAGGSAAQPFIIRAKAGERVVVSGAEVVTGTWTPDAAREGVWKLPLPPALNGAVELFSYSDRAPPPRFSLGQVIVDGVPWPMAVDDDELRAGVGLWWFDHGSGSLLLHPQDGSVLKRPGAIEVTTRRQWVAPRVKGLGHVQIEGIRFQYAGNPFPHSFWNRRTGVPQVGAISTFGGHHWTIRRCSISHVRGIGISCGADEIFEDPVGQRPYSDVGFHVIEHNYISDCGVCGIAGAGHRQTVIRHNFIERCNTDGWTAPECAGIKLHFCYDCLVEGNVIRDIEASGIWLDNQWYGSRVTRNVVLNTRGQGIFIEMGDGPCLVDHNITAFVRAGDGLYLHDASGVTVAHNLSFCNAHFGLYARCVTERRAAASSGQWKTVACDRLDIRNNLFIDNYRGHVCLPLPGNRSEDNRCDFNLFVNGAQWHWEAQPFHQFAVNANDGRVDFERMRKGIDCHVGEDADLHFTPGVAANGSLAIGLEVWRRLGWDRSSGSSAIPQPQVDNGAVTRGAATLAAHALFLRISGDRSIYSQLSVPAIGWVEGVGGMDCDFMLQPLHAAVHPGPIQAIADLSGPVSLIPLSRGTDGTE